jgi:hypothetical protein
VSKDDIDCWINHPAYDRSLWVKVVFDGRMIAIKTTDEALNLLRVTPTPLEVRKITSWVCNCIKTSHTTHIKMN